MADDSTAMKIVFLMQDTGGVYGAERATIELARGLRAAGVEVHALLIVETRLGLERSRLQDAFATAGVPLSTVVTSARFSLKLARAIADEVQRVGGTILHSTGYKADIHGLLATRSAKVPLVSTVHGWLFRPDFKERFYAWLNVQAFKRCARVIALTSYYENLLRAKGIARVVKIPTGIAVETQLPGIAERPFTFGILGRLSWEKPRAVSGSYRGAGAARRAGAFHDCWRWSFASWHRITNRKSQIANRTEWLHPDCRFFQPRGCAGNLFAHR
jgi:glycosyltransferase involved in cell wall biosynthesis